jgi:hypothetical protein
MANAPPVPNSGISWIFANLPAGTPLGTQLLTSDQGWCVNTAQGWVATATQVTPAATLTNMRPFLAKGPGNVQQLMASPPTVAIATTNPASAGQQFIPTVQGAAQSAINTANWSFHRSGSPAVYGNTNPNYNFIGFNSIPSATGSNVVSTSVIFSGTVLVYRCKGVASSVFVKVNDQYVSLTPVAVPSNGSSNYISVTFGSAVVGARVEFIQSNIFGSCAFGGMWTGSNTDTLEPAEIRGPRIIVLGDSVTTATGSTGSAALGFVQVMAEYLGFDDVWPSGIGGTGMINAGTYVTYINRLATDVFPYNPSEVIIQGFYNDSGASYATILAAANAIIASIQANLPLAKITFLGPYAPYGAGYQLGSNTGAGFVAQRAALRAAVAGAANPLVSLIDPSSMPLNSVSNIAQTPFATTVTASVAANATSITTAIPLIPGLHYQFVDGSIFRCLSVAGNVATIDQAINAQASNSAVTQVGNCWITGNGYQGATTGVGNADNFIFTDHVHPVNLGHYHYGVEAARQWVQNANRLSNY